jgi:hypothetical protein
MRSTGTARFQLGCEITELKEGLEVAWLFWPRLFPIDEIKSLASMFQSVLAGACGSPERHIDTLVTQTR